MPTTLRGWRHPPPELPVGELRLEPPPELRRNEGAAGVLMNAVPMLGSVGSIVLVATMGGAHRERGLLAAGMFLFATLGFVLVQVDRQRKQRAHQVAGSRDAYLRHLAGARRTVRDAAARQRRALAWLHPEPAALPALAAQRDRVWERGRGDDWFLHVRYGVGSQPLALELLPPEVFPAGPVDPVAAAALRRFVGTHGMQHHLPATAALGTLGRVELRGPPERVHDLARAMVCAAVTFHDPDRLVVAALVPERHLVRWDWLKWLPHTDSRRRRDAVGPRRMVTADPDELDDLLGDPLREPTDGWSAGDDGPGAPHVLLVLDGLGPPDHLVPTGRREGVTVLDLTGRGDETREGPGDPAELRLVLTDASAPKGTVPALLVRPGHEPLRVGADQCDVATAEALARRLAPLRTTANGRAGPAGVPAGDLTAAAPDPLVLLGLDGPEGLDAVPRNRARRSRSARDRLRVPVGVDAAGAPVHLDLKEPAEQGMGPHGLVVGATGSGKSELLRTLVLGLATTHSPEELNLVLVDFKGGATFAGMSDLPHVSALITNLADELTLVDRMQDALSGEMLRRQELLRSAGNFASARDHERARAAGEDLVPMPSLLVVVDEFSELLSEKPEFTDLFVAIGRLGRSLGIHLLLASQRLEEGRLRGLESHLSYRVGLRTFSAGESRTVLGVPDAHELPAVPGLGYLRPDPATLVRFKAAHVSGPSPAHERRDRTAEPRGPHDVTEVLPWTLAPVMGHPLAPDAAPAPERSAAEGPTVLDLAVARLAGRGPAAHQVWLPPLERPDTLDALLPDLAEDPDLGLVSGTWRARPGLRVPLGTVDRPREQRHDPLVLDLGGAAGHVAVVGGPRSGKSTLLRSLVASTSLVTTPLEVQFLVLDLGGGTLASLAQLPHVSGVAAGSEPDVVRRVIAEVQGVLDHRESSFRRHGIDSVETYRARRGEGLVDDGWGDVFLVVDGWGALRANYDDLEMELQQLAGRGLAYGIHLVTSAVRWADYRAGLRDLFGSRLELRLGDPLTSEVDRAAAGRVPTGRPGRGLTPGGHHFLGALPRVDGCADGDDVRAGVEDLVRRSAAAWLGPPGPELRLLPDRITLDTVRADAARTQLPARHLLLGIDERELATVGLDVDTDPHLLAFGDGRSGKTTLLRSYLREVLRTRSPAQAQVVLVDYRRSLLGEVPDAHLLHYLTSAHQAGPALQELATYLHGRVPGPDVTRKQLRDRSWWTGAEVFVVVDDYDLVSTQLSSPVQALQPLLAQAPDVGLHLALARRAGGASRALHEPVVQSLRDLAAPGVLLSGPREEGLLLGGLRPEPAAPGRARLVTRERGVETLQLACCEPAT